MNDIILRKTIHLISIHGDNDDGDGRNENQQSLRKSKKLAQAIIIIPQGPINTANFYQRRRHVNDAQKAIGQSQIRYENVEGRHQYRLFDHLKSIIEYYFQLCVNGEGQTVQGD